MSKITGKEYPIKEIFTDYFEYHIPSYQRPYAWDTEHASKLFEDLEDFYRKQFDKDEDYFLGSIVLIKEEDKPYAEVVDGQQRLTTLTILLSVLASKVQDARFKTSIKKLLVTEENAISEIKAQPRLFLRPKEQTFFEKYVLEQDMDGFLGLKREDPQFDTEAKIHIWENYRLFCDKIDEKFHQDDMGLQNFIKFIYSRCYMVSVATSNQTSAFRIFFVMNDRGLPLLPVDKFKADIIGKISTPLQETYTRKWEDIEMELERANFNELFVHIRMLYAKEKLREDLVSNFQKSVIPNITSSEKFIDDILLPYSVDYQTIRNSSYKSTSSYVEEINNVFKWLNKGFNYDWIPATLRFMRNKPNPDYLLWFLKKMERLAVCMMVTGQDVNKRITRYCQILDEMEKRAGHSISSPLTSVELTDEEKKAFLEVLGGDVYYMTSRYRNYIIQRLDSFVSDGAATYDEKVFTIEHVLPQTVDPESQWAQLWPDEERRAYWLHKVANLVPLARKVNSSAQNYDFDEKKEKYFRNSRTGTTSYNLTTQVLSIPVWTEDVVKNRQEYLLNVFKSNWEL